MGELIRIVFEQGGDSNAERTSESSASLLAQTTYADPQRFFDTLEKEVLKVDGIVMRGIDRPTSSPNQTVYLDLNKLTDIAKGQDIGRVGIVQK